MKKNVVLTLEKENVCQFEEGDIVRFEDFEQAEFGKQLGKEQFKVLKKIDKHTIQLQLDLSKFAPITKPGKIVECKQPLNLKYIPLKCAKLSTTQDEKLKYYDFTKLKHQELLEICFLALSKYIEKYNKQPKHWSNEDIQKFLEIVNDVSNQLGFQKEEEIDQEKFFREFCWINKGVFPPLGAYFGGIIS